MRYYVVAVQIEGEKTIEGYYAGFNNFFEMTPSGGAEYPDKKTAQLVAESLHFANKLLRAGILPVPTIARNKVKVAVAKPRTKKKSPAR